jgi:hypothetical protein
MATDGGSKQKLYRPKKAPPVYCLSLPTPFALLGRACCTAAVGGGPGAMRALAPAGVCVAPSAGARTTGQLAACRLAAAPRLRHCAPGAPARCVALQVRPRRVVTGPMRRSASLHGVPSPGSQRSRPPRRLLCPHSRAAAAVRRGSPQLAAARGRIGSASPGAAVSVVAGTEPSGDCTCFRAPPALCTGSDARSATARRLLAPAWRRRARPRCCPRGRR